MTDNIKIYYAQTPGVLMNAVSSGTPLETNVELGWHDIDSQQGKQTSGDIVHQLDKEELMKAAYLLAGERFVQEAVRNNESARGSDPHISFIGDFSTHFPNYWIPSGEETTSEGGITLPGAAAGPRLSVTIQAMGYSQFKNNMRPIGFRIEK